MKYDKYYEHIYTDGKLNSRFVTYLSSIHMANTLTKRDKISNNPIRDIGNNYCQKALEFYDNATNPLSFLNDDIQIIYDYSIDHVEKILINPHQNIIKEKKLVRKENLKAIDSKTFTWLASKPGSSIREKLANVDKVSSTVKRYSYNVKENQVLLAYFRKITRIINQKIYMMKNHPDLFGDVSSEIDNLNISLKKINFTIKELFAEVLEKEYSTPNNALIGNVDYSSVWKSYLDLKQLDVDYGESFEMYKESFSSMFIAVMMSRYDFIENDADSLDINSYVLLEKANNQLIELMFNQGESLIITINKYLLDDMSLVETNKYDLKLVEEDSDSNRGICFSVSIEDELLGLFYADILGAKELIDAICQRLQLKQASIIKDPEKKKAYTYISINSFDNRQYDKSDDYRISIRDNGFAYFNKDIVFADEKNIYYNKYLNDNYLELLRLNSLNHDFLANPIIVYDINDNYDEFSSAKLRKTFSSIYTKSYPVWRSILAGESYADSKNVRTVIDYCGEDFSISKLERKKDRFIHCGPIEIPIYYQIFNELDCYNFYIKKFENKKGVVFPQNIKDEFISSGLLHSILCKRIDDVILADGTMTNHKYFKISFDDECYQKMFNEFKNMFDSIRDRYDNSTIFIIPDFLKAITLNYNNTICNASLESGARVIIDRLNKNEITWYEKLPKLSLEVIKNGMYDDLILVDNQECENIIGKKLTIKIKEPLTLSKGKKNYILPLNKSFIGEQNDSFVAKAEDPSFPLQEDVEVNLILEYSFGAENSYNLFLIPKKKKSPFDSIEIKWEKEIIYDNLIYPNIVDVTYSDNLLDIELNDRIPKTLELFSNHINNIKRNKIKIITKSGKTINCVQEASRDIKILINKCQRISHYTNESKEKVRKVISDYDVYDNVMFLLERARGPLKSDSVDEGYKQLMEWRASELEEALIEVSFDSNLYKEGFLMFPEATYGRYFAEKPDDVEVINIAYSQLIAITSEEGYFDSPIFRRYINKFTSATACRHKDIYEIAKAKPVFITYLLKVITKTLRELSLFDWNKNLEECTYSNNPKENGFLLRYCVELLISFIFCRDLDYFDDLKPSGKLAKEIIYYLKAFNRNIMNAMEKWDDNSKKDKMLKTKYNISLEKPIDLNRMWDEAYCLILYLSGDERANYIKIGSGERNE